MLVLMMRKVVILRCGQSEIAPDAMLWTCRFLRRSTGTNRLLNVLEDLVFYGVYVVVAAFRPVLTIASVGP